MNLMSKEDRDHIEGTMDPNRRFKMPPEMTDAMRNAAYQTYCKRYSEKRYIAWEDVCACFVSAFDAAKSDQER